MGPTPLIRLREKLASSSANALLEKGRGSTPRLQIIGIAFLLQLLLDCCLRALGVFPISHSRACFF